MVLSVIIYCQFLFWTVVYSVLLAPFFAVSMLWCAVVPGADMSKAVRFFILWYGKTIIRVALFPWVKIVYENVAKEKICGGIYVFNHRSGSDPFLVSAITNEPPVQIVNDWPMRLPYFGFFARLGKYLDIKHMTYEEVRDAIREFVAQGAPVMAFPEGTRSGGKFMNQFHSAVFYVAKEINCPIIPVAVAGNENIPNRAFKMHCGTILIRKLPAVPRTITESYSPYKLKQYVRNIILKETTEMDLLLEGNKK